MVTLIDIINDEYVRFLIILIATIIIVTISYIILKLIVKRIAGKKKKYGEYILKKLTKPTLLIVFFVGLYTAIKPLTLLYQYGNWIDGFFFVVITLIFARLISNFLNIIMIGYLKVRKDFQRTPVLLSRAVSIIIFTIAIVIILGYFKLDITPLIAGVGLGALAIGLALQSTLSNFFAGIHIISDRPIDIGDFIELDQNTSGFVEDIGWRSTRIRTWTDNLIVIPNAKLADSNIFNYSKPKKDMSFFIPCGVAYESDLKKVEKNALEVAKKIQQTTTGAKKDFEPLFRFKEFGDSNIEFITILRVEEPMKRFPVRNEFIKALKERFDKEDIEISWPIRKIYNIK